MFQEFLFLSVKHLNPRQGITTGRHVMEDDPISRMGVKHLKPGDYNGDEQTSFVICPMGCETPKSPPGDYNWA
jgi:hypothetical protein